MADNQRLKVGAGLPIESGQGHARMRAPIKGTMTMKLRIFRLLTTVAMLAVLIEALGAGAKW
jgi:hypothetical protein